MMILDLPELLIQLLVDRHLYNFYSDAFTITLYNDTFTMVVCSGSHLKTSCGELRAAIMHLYFFSYHVTLSHSLEH